MAFLVAPIKTENRNSDPLKAAKVKAEVEEKLQVQQQTARPAVASVPPSAQKTTKGLAAGMLFQDRLTQSRASDSLTEARKPAAQKLKEAQTLYDTYVQSDEHRQNLAAADQKARLDALMTATITGSSDTMTQPIQDKKEQELRALVDHYTAQVQQEESQRLMAADLQELDTWEEADRAALETYIINRNTDFANKLNPMLDPGFGTATMGASGLIQKYGLKRVNEMAESLNRSRNAEITQQAAQAAQAGADEGAWSALGHNAASVPVGAVGGLTGLFGYLQELGERSGRYPTMDPNNMGNLPSVYAGAVRGQTAQNIEESVGGVGGKIASLGYQGVMSMADSYARLVLGGGAAGGAALAATNTFAQTMSEASARGATPGQAALLATTKAGIEALSEKIPLDNLLDTAKSGGKGLTDAVIDAFAQAGVEITTEEVSLFGSVLAEAAILREKSAYANASWEDLLMEAAETAAVSGISGGLSSAGASVVGNVMAPAANPQQNPQIAAENAAPVKAEPEAAVTPENVAEQLGKEVSRTEPAQKAKQEMTLDQAMQEVLGQEGNDFGSRAAELERAQAQEESLRGAAEAYANAGDARAAAEVEADRQKYGDRVRSAQDQEEARTGSLTDRDAPTPGEAPYPGSRNQDSDPLQARSWAEAGSRKTKAYMAENPEVKPFLQLEAQAMAEELSNTTKGERTYDEQLHYDSGGEKGWYGVKRHTSEDIAELRDSGMSYEQIGKGLNDIIEDHGKENSAAAKRVEMQLNDRLRTGHKDFMTGKWVRPNQAYIDTVNEAEASREGREAFDALMEDADHYAPHEQNAERGTQQADAQNVSLQGKRSEESQRLRTPTYEEVAQKNDIPVISVGRNPEGKDYAELKTDALQIAEMANWYDAPYTNKDTGMPVFLTRKSFTHSFSRLTSDFGTDTLLALQKMPEIIREAVLVHVAPPKNRNKPENRVMTFLAAIDGENGVEPVKITVKEYNSNDGNPMPKNILDYFNRTRMSEKYNSLYDLKALEVVEVEGTKKELGASAIVADGSQKPGANSTPNSTIRVTDLLGLVKGDAEKYIPRPGMKGTGAAQSGGFEAMGAADQNFSNKLAYNATLSEDNAQPDRRDDVRPVELPARDINGGRVSAVTGNVYAAGITPDEFASLMEEPTARGDFSYIPLTNNQATQNATEYISRLGWDDAYHQWAADVRQGMAGAAMSARGALFLNHAAQAGDRQLWLNVLSDFQRLGTNTAQGLQAFRIVRQLAPSDRLYLIRRSVQQMVEDMHLRVPIEIDQDMADRYQNAPTNEEADAILDEIMDDVAAQIPSTVGEWWTALRYVNMLGNLRTQVRNISGNVGAKAAFTVKDQIAAALEKAVAAVNPNFQRTKSNWVSQELKDLGRADFEEIRDVLLDGGRFDDARRFDSTRFAREVNERRRIFRSGIMERYRQATNWAMNNEYFGDAGFARSAYARAFGGYLKANGFTGSTLDGIDQNLLDNARLYAIQQAQESTFRDRNALSDWISGIGRRQGTPAAIRAISEGVMPFRRTPANVLIRAEEFSPLGIINTSVIAAQRAAGNSRIADGNGIIADWARAGQEISGTDVVESMAKTLTGTGLFFMGMLLGGAGLLTGGPDADEEKDAFDRENGEQNYALQLPGGENVTIDWLSPIAVPMFLGSAVEKIISDGDYTIADFEKVFTSLADPLIQMSMLQGVNDTLDNLKYSQNNLGQFFINAAVSYLAQGLTNTLMGQIEKSTEAERTTTYVNKDSNVPQWAQRQLGKVSQKIPFWDYQQTPYINARGETQTQRTDLLGWLYNLTSPGYVNKFEVDSVSEELYRLNETGATESNVFLDSPSTTVSYTDKDGVTHKDYNLTAEEADTLKRVTGQTSVEALKGLFESETYKAMTDQQKAKAVELAYDYAREKGRTAALEGYEGLDGWMEGIEGKEADAILDKAVKNAFTDAFEQLATDPEGAAAALDQAYSLVDQHGITEWAKEAGGRTKYFIGAKRRGVDAATFTRLYQQFRDIDQNPDYNTGDKAAEWSYQLQKAQEAGTITMQQKDALKDSMVYYQMFPAETAKFDQMAEAGISADKAMDIGQLLDGIKPQEGYTNVRDVQKASALAGSSLSRSEKTAAMKIYLSDAQDENLDLMLGLGYGPEDYAAVYEIYSGESGKGKKARTISKIQNELGVDYGTAREIYEIYG